MRLPKQRPDGIAVAMAPGEACGIAAELALREKVEVRKIAVPDL